MKKKEIKNPFQKDINYFKKRSKKEIDVLTGGDFTNYMKKYGIRVLTKEMESFSYKEFLFAELLKGFNTIMKLEEIGIHILINTEEHFEAYLKENQENNILVNTYLDGEHQQFLTSSKNKS